MTEQRPAHAVVWPVLLNIPTALMAGMWILAMLFASAMGSKPPTLWQYLDMMWPALVGLTVAGLSLFLALRANQIAGVLLGVAGLPILPIAFQTMIR